MGGCRASTFRHTGEGRYPDQPRLFCRGLDPGLRRGDAEGFAGELLRSRFERAVKKHGLNQEKRPLRCDLFEPPQGPQLRLL